MVSLPQSTSLTALLPPPGHPQRTASCPVQACVCARLRFRAAEKFLACSVLFLLPVLASECRKRKMIWFAWKEQPLHSLFFFPRGIRSLSIEEIRLDPLGAEESVIILFRAIFKCERKSFNFPLFDYLYEMKIEPIQAQNRYHFSFVETNFLFSKYDAVFLRTDPIPRSHSRRSINKQVDRQNSVDYLAGCWIARYRSTVGIFKASLDSTFRRYEVIAWHDE